MAKRKLDVMSPADVHRKFKAHLERQQRSFKAVCELAANMPQVDALLRTTCTVAAKEENTDARYRKQPVPGEVAKRRAFIERVVTHLFELGAAADAPDETGATALYYAASGDLGVLRMLLQHGARPNAPAGRITPLMVACMAKFPRIENVRALLEAGADPTARHDGSYTASKAASRNPNILALLQQHGASAPPKPSIDPARDAREGNVDALRAMADNNARKKNDAAAYKWLCVAADHGHEAAAGAAIDVLEQSSLRYDDDGLIQGQTHWELACSYFEGTDGFAQSDEHATSHLKTAARIAGAQFNKRYKPDELMRRLKGVSRTALERALG